MFIFCRPANAQNVCYDQSQVSYNTQCATTFNPVCGCNNQTYRNECIALRHNGIVSYQSGICEALAVELMPNPVNDKLKIMLMRKEEGDVYVSIFDIYGKVHYSQQFHKVTSLEVPVNTTDFRNGLYILMATTTKFGVVKKFLKQPQP